MLHNATQRYACTTGDMEERIRIGWCKGDFGPTFCRMVQATSDPDIRGLLIGGRWQQAGARTRGDLRHLGLQVVRDLFQSSRHNARTQHKQNKNAEG